MHRLWHTIYLMFRDIYLTFKGHPSKPKDHIRGNVSDILTYTIYHDGTNWTFHFLNINLEVTRG